MPMVYACMEIRAISHMIDRLQNITMCAISSWKGIVAMVRNVGKYFLSDVGILSIQ